MAIKTDMLRYFVEVANTGNLSAAAKNLGRTPAAVSMMLKQFEENLGGSLFASDRKNQLSELGRFTLGEAERELAHFNQMVSSVMRFAATGEGSVKLAVMPAAAANLMPTVIERLHAENPDILVEVEDTSNEGILSAVRGETADVGIVNSITIAGYSNIRSSILISDRIGLLCARNSELGRKENLYWSDLANTPIVSHNLCDRIDEPAVRKAVANSRTRVASALSIQSFVKSGEYVSPMPELGGIDLPNNLVFRIPEGEVYRRQSYLIWNENHKPSFATLKLCQIMREVLEGMGMAPETTENEKLLNPK